MRMGLRNSIDKRDHTRELTPAERAGVMNRGRSRERVAANRQIENLTQNDRIIELLELLTEQNARLIELAEHHL